MADKQESALTQQSDCKWVRALDANGNSIRISKEDLAAVVGELLGNPLSEKGSVFNGDDLNNYTQSGIYGVNAVGGTITNMPSSTLIGELIVFKSSRNSASGGYPIVQIYVTYTVESMFIRCQWAGNWNSWRRIQIVQV